MGTSKQLATAMAAKYVNELYVLKSKARLEAKDLPRLRELRKAIEVLLLINKKG